MTRLDTLVEDESIQESEISADDVVETMLDDAAFRKLLLKFVKGDIVGRRFEEAVFDLRMEAENEIVYKQIQEARVASYEE